MSYWWLSFCDPKRPRGTQFLGACLVEADSMPEALSASWSHKCNPGGEVLAYEVPAQYQHNIQRFELNTLLSEQQIKIADTNN